MKINAVGFDFDGTLYPEWSLYIRSMGLGFRHPRFFLAYQSTRSRLRTGDAGSLVQSREMTCADGLEEKRSTLELFRRGQAESIGRSLGISAKKAAELTDSIIYASIDSAFAYIKPYGGVPGCLEKLKAAGLRLGILSDLPPWEKAKALGLDGYFDSILCSECSGRLKPNRKPFIYLSDKLGFRPEEILYVGNNWRYDIEGAHNAGMMTAYLGSRPGTARCYGKAKCRDTDRVAAPPVDSAPPADSAANAVADFCFTDWAALADFVLAHNGQVATGN
ncbi:MAG: HAD family hydrolase [Spirochaetaceae bacterium]|nr:HAD family hydrolase [Spirochaetaceae bacterium]